MRSDARVPQLRQDVELAARALDAQHLREKHALVLVRWIRKAVGCLVERTEGDGVDLALFPKLDRISEIVERAAAGLGRDLADRDLGRIGIAEIDEHRTRRLRRQLVTGADEVERELSAGHLRTLLKDT